MKTKTNSASSVQPRKRTFWFVLIPAVILVIAAGWLLASNFKVISISGETESYILESNQTQWGLLFIDDNASAIFQEKSHWIGPIISAYGVLTVENDVTIRGPVVISSDSLVLGENATLHGNVWLFAGSLRLKPGARVLHSAILTAGAVFLEQGASINDDLISFAGGVELHEKASLRGNVVLFAGGMVIGEEATVYGKSIFFAGGVEMAAHSTALDNVVLLAGDIHLYPGAQVKGNVFVTDGNATLDGESVIDGKLYLNPESRSGRGNLLQSAEAEITRGVVKPGNIKLISGWQMGWWIVPLMLKYFLPVVFIFGLLMVLMFQLGRRSRSLKPTRQQERLAEAKS